MARILLTTFGSIGDLFPFVALGLGLQARGHDVRFAVEDAFRPTLLEAGFDSVYHLSGDVEAVLGPRAQTLYTSRSPLTSLRLIVRDYIVPTMPPKIDELRALCRDVDLIVASTQHVAAFAVSELTNIPLATVVLSPALLPSAHLEPGPGPVLSGRRQHIANRLGWGIGNLLLRSIGDGPVNHVRASYGLPPRRNVLNTGSLSPHLAVLTVSPAFVSPQPDWPPQVRVTGFCFWDRPGSWVEPAQLTAFLADPRPVVAVSSGSLSTQTPEVFDRFFQVSVEAIRQIGARTLVLGATAESLPATQSNGVLRLPYAPFSQIYPHCAAVIHHGGIGTIGQALRAGVPMLIVPWGIDQVYLAVRVARVGAGRWLSRRRYTARRATSALRALLESEMYREQTQRIAQVIAHEDGVAAACDALESLATTMPPRTR
jgi:UDP:flavonoid glycosyltransferase YjiC (YdhE family)